MREIHAGWGQGYGEEAPAEFFSRDSLTGGVIYDHRNEHTEV